MKWLLPFIVLFVLGCDVDQIPQDLAESLTPAKTAPTPSRPVSVPTPPPVESRETNEPARLVAIAGRYLYVRENEGFNRSPEIDRWNIAAGVPFKSPYCAAYLAAVHREAGIKAPNSAYSPDWFRTNRIAFTELSKGDVAGIHFPSKSRVAHVLLIAGEQGAYFKSLEANTSPDANGTEAKSREGDGVWKKIRSKKLLSDSRNRFSRYWK